MCYNLYAKNVFTPRKRKKQEIHHRRVVYLRAGKTDHPA
jgi:hypothetical protein